MTEAASHLELDSRPYFLVVSGVAKACPEEFLEDVIQEWIESTLGLPAPYVNAPDRQLRAKAAEAGLSLAKARTAFSRKIDGHFYGKLEEMVEKGRSVVLVRRLDYVGQRVRLLEGRAVGYRKLAIQLSSWENDVTTALSEPITAEEGFDAVYSAVYDVKEEVWFYEFLPEVSGLSVARSQG